jgi:hypothetical protein
MSVRLLDRAISPVTIAPTPARSKGAPDEGYDAIPHLSRLRDRLVAAVAERQSRPWNEPTLFFFDTRRQADYAEARQTPPTDPCADISTAIASELPTLIASIDVRRVARAIDGLHRAAQALATKCAAAKDLADLLAIPDDEVIVVLVPERRMGFRFAIRGITDVGQLHILLTNALAGQSLVDRPFAERFVTASLAANATTPAGVPMVAEARYQLYAPAALGPDGSLPSGMDGCEHWLWPTTPLAAVPRVHGERIILAGPLVFHAIWNVSPRFPALAAELRLVEPLSPFRVADRLSRLPARPRAPVQPHAQAPVLSKTV